MSYRCGLCSAHVYGIPQIKLVTKIREIDYTVTGNGNDRHVLGSEIAEELKICPECQKRYGDEFKPQIIGKIQRSVQSRVKKDRDFFDKDRDFREDWEERY